MVLVVLIVLMARRMAGAADAWQTADSLLMGTAQVEKRPKALLAASTSAVFFR